MSEGPSEQDWTWLKYDQILKAKNLYYNLIFYNNIQVKLLHPGGPAAVQTLHNNICIQKQMRDIMCK